MLKKSSHAGERKLQTFAGAMIAAGRRDYRSGPMLERSVPERDNSAGFGRIHSLSEREIVKARGSGGQESSTNWGELCQILWDPAPGGRGESVRPGRGGWATGCRRFRPVLESKWERGRMISLPAASETGGSLASTMGSMIANG